MDPAKLRPGFQNLLGLSLMVTSQEGRADVLPGIQGNRAGILLCCMLQSAGDGAALGTARDVSVCSTHQGPSVRMLMAYVWKASRVCLRG